MAHSQKFRASQRKARVLLLQLLTPGGWLLANAGCCSCKVADPRRPHCGGLVAAAAAAAGQAHEHFKPNSSWKGLLHPRPAGKLAIQIVVVGLLKEMGLRKHFQPSPSCPSVTGGPFWLASYATHHHQEEHAAIHDWPAAE